MNCHKSHQLLSAERDGFLTADQQISLETHLKDCSRCRKVRPLVAASVESWRDSTASIQMPDVDRAWQDIRRAKRTEGSANSRHYAGALRWIAPLGIAAGLAVIASVTPRWQNHAQAALVAQQEKAHADYVDVPSDASSMVYVDDQSGWLVIWSDGSSEPTGG